jgi:hypothetical protein
MDRLSLRAWLATLLVGSALLFFVGIYLERGGSAPERPVASAPSSQPEASNGEGGGEGAEAGHSDAPAASAGATGETAGEHAAEARPFGIDVESPLLVDSVIVISLLLALAVLRTTTPFVPVAIVGFAVIFALFDALEVSFQLGASRPGLALIAALLIALHVVTGLIALRLVRRQRGGPLATR